MKYRLNVGHADFCTKARKVEQMLRQGHKVKVTLTFRGREVAHPERGGKLLDRLVEAVEEVGRVQNEPYLTGRTMVMILTPK